MDTLNSIALHQSFALAPLVGFALLIAVSPGPSNVLLLAVGSRLGTLGGLPILSGMALGYGLLWGASVLLLNALSDLDPRSLGIAKWVGATVMAWFAWRLASAVATAKPDGTTDTTSASFLDGLVFQFSNPKAWLSAYAASSLLGEIGANPALRAALFGSIATIAVLGGCGLWLIAGHAGSKWLRHPIVTRILNVALLGMIAISLAPVLVG